MTMSKRLAAFRENARAEAESPPREEENLTPNKPGEENGALPTPPSNEREKSMTDEEMKAEIEKARAEGHQAGLKAANERISKVHASEHYAGREAAAAKLFSKPNLSAEDITELLADMPKAAAPASGLTEEQQRAAAEEAGRQEMRSALEQNKNSDIDAGGGAQQPDKRAASDAVWDKAYGLKGAR